MPFSARNLLLTTGLVLVISIDLFSQRHAFCGFILEFGSEEPVIGAHIVLNDSLSFVSGRDGEFCFLLPESIYRITITHLGYERYEVDTSLTGGTTMILYLNKAHHLLPQIEVTVPRHLRRINQSVIDLPIDKMDYMPRLMGEADPIKALTLFPGVSSGSEGTAGLYVRGGSPDQNLYLLDEVPLYNTNHFFGYVSTVNPLSIKSLKLFKGGIPSSFGGRTSSYIDIITKEGDKSEFHWGYSLGLITNTASLEGPIIKDKASITIATRLGNVSAITWPAAILFESGGIDQYATYNMYDVNAKITFGHPSKAKVSLSIYAGQDQIPQWVRDDDLVSKQLSNYGNINAVLKHTARARANFFTKTLSYFTRYRDKTQFKRSEQVDLNGQQMNTSSSLDDSWLTELGLKHKSQIYLNTNTRVDFGGDIALTTVSPNNVTVESIIDNMAVRDVRRSNISTILQMAPFASIQYSSRPLSFELGVRNSNYFSENFIENTLEPRVSLNYNLSADLEVSAYYSSLSQPLHLLSSVNIGLPSDTWVARSAMFPSSRSNNFSLELSQRFDENSLNIYVAMFYRRFRNLIDYRRGVRFRFDTRNDYRDKVHGEGIGRAKGLEVLIEKKHDLFDLIFSGTLSKSERRFSNINAGEWIRARFDRRFDFNLTSIFNLSSKVKLTGAFIYTTGFPITLPEYYTYTHIHTHTVPAFGKVVPNYPRRFNDESPAYWRFDVQVARKYLSKKGHKAFWSAGVYNFLFKTNPSVIELEDRFRQDDMDGVFTSDFRKIGRALFTFVPFFTIGREF